MVAAHDTTTTAATSDPLKTPSTTGAATDEATQRIEAMISRGATPAEIGSAVGPSPQPAVMTLLHQTRGNAFVQQVMFFSRGGGGGGSGAQPTTQPTNQPLAQAPVMLADAPLDHQPLVTPPKHYMPAQPAFVVNVDGQDVQVFVSPDGLTENPDVFMFFHGQSANLQLGKKTDGGDNVSGKDTAGAAMAKGKEKNTIAFLPQGLRAGGGTEGGRMDAIIKNGLAKFIDDLLVASNRFIGAPSLTPNHIGLAGHSAGGHEGIAESLANLDKNKYSDNITDITLMDASYADTHFQEARDWMFTGSPGKTVRIVQKTGQLQNDVYYDKKTPTPENPKLTTPTLDGDAHWSRYFSDAKLDGALKAHPGWSVNHLKTFDFKNKDSYGTGEDRGNLTEMVQHSQIIDDKSQVHCDILVMHSDLGHHEVRDSTMDDAIDSIGQGAAGSDQFGRNNDDPTYGRDPSMPHENNGPTAEEIEYDRAHPKPKTQKPPPKRPK